MVIMWPKGHMYRKVNLDVQKIPKNKFLLPFQKKKTMSSSKHSWSIGPVPTTRGNVDIKNHNSRIKSHIQQYRKQAQGTVAGTGERTIVKNCL